MDSYVENGFKSENLCSATKTIRNIYILNIKRHI